MTLVLFLTKLDWCADLRLEEYLLLKRSDHEVSGHANLDSEDDVVDEVNI